MSSRNQFRTITGLAHDVSVFFVCIPSNLSYQLPTITAEFNSVRVTRKEGTG